MPTYNIHDNGGVPFIVDVIENDNIIRIYLSSTWSYENEHENDEKGQLIAQETYENIWIGDNDLNDHHYTQRYIYPGNSILVHLSGKRYMYIGSEIYKFNIEIGDRIISYFSPIGNSDVPYPYAIGEQMAYFMLDKKLVPIDTIDVTVDGYQQFYMSENDKHSFNYVRYVHKRRH